MRGRSLGFLVFASVFVLFGCSKSKTYQSTVEVLQTQALGSDPQGPTVLDLDLLFVDCPGAQRKVVRGDKVFGKCAQKIKKGDRVPVEILATYRADRGEWRNEVVRVADCPRTVDPKDDASYEVVQDCKDVVINGVPMGIHCDKTRSEALVAKCPWFRRK